MAGCFQEYLQRLPDLFVEKMEDDININLFSNNELKNEQNLQKLLKYLTLFYKFNRFTAVEKLAVISGGLFHRLLELKIFSHHLSYMNFLIKLTRMVWFVYNF